MDSAEQNIRGIGRFDQVTWLKLDPTDTVMIAELAIQDSGMAALGEALERREKHYLAEGMLLRGRGDGNESVRVY
ncbi:MAG: hypothetical protein ACT4OO_16390 [Nitrospiraceae bacterium]